MIDNCEVFEKILEIEEQGPQGKTIKKHPIVTYEKLVKELIEPYEIPIEQLCAPKPGSMDYESRWETEWKRMLDVITLGYLKHFCIECYNCPRGVDDVDLFSQLRKVRMECINCVCNMISIS